MRESSTVLNGKTIFITKVTKEKADQLHPFPICVHCDLAVWAFSRQDTGEPTGTFLLLSSSGMEK